MTENKVKIRQKEAKFLKKRVCEDIKKSLNDFIIRELGKGYAGHTDVQVACA